VKKMRFKWMFEIPQNSHEITPRGKFLHFSYD
jgi:hypothetical protein